jgi:hypothetical protein
MSRDDRIDRVGDADQGAFYLLIAVAAGFEQGSMRGSLHTLFDLIAFHGGILPAKKNPLPALGPITDFDFGVIASDHYRPLDPESNNDTEYENNKVNNYYILIFHAGSSPE